MSKKYFRGDTYHPGEGGYDGEFVAVDISKKGHGQCIELYGDVSGDDGPLNMREDEHRIRALGDYLIRCLNNRDVLESVLTRLRDRS